MLWACLPMSIGTSDRWCRDSLCIARHCMDLHQLNRTVHDLFGVSGSLSARDAWAGSLAPILTGTLKEARTDCPATMPNPPGPTVDARQKLGQEWTQPLNDWQESVGDVRHWRS